MNKIRFGPLLEDESPDTEDQSLINIEKKKIFHRKMEPVEVRDTCKQLA